MAQTTSYYFTDNEISQLTGHYEFSERRILKISNQDNILFGEMTGQSQLELTPAGPYIVYATDIDVRLEFTKNEKEEVTGLLMSLASIQEAKKLNLENQKISKKWKKKYIGKYRISDNNFVELGIKDNNWYIIENDEFVDLVPIRQHVFYSPERVSKYQLNLSPDGKNVQSLTMLVGTTIEMDKVNN